MELNNFRLKLLERGDNSKKFLKRRKPMANLPFLLVTLPFILSFPATLTEVEGLINLVYGVTILKTIILLFLFVCVVSDHVDRDQLKKDKKYEELDKYFFVDGYGNLDDASKNKYAKLNRFIFGLGAASLLTSTLYMGSFILATIFSMSLFFASVSIYSGHQAVLTRKEEIKDDINIEYLEK